MNRFSPLELTATAASNGEAVGLVLRPWREQDIGAITRACADPATQQWLALPSPYTREDAAMYVAARELARRDGDGVSCAVTLASGGAVVGSVALAKTDWRARVTEVGYWAVPDYRGRGYITAATRALSHWALSEGFARVECKAAPQNVASNRVAVNAGFVLEGLLHNAGVVRGGRVDLNLYGLTPERVAASTATPSH